jgi:tetratricopeptide (TPR) repeat protein
MFVDGTPVPDSFFTEDHESQRMFFDQAIKQVESLAKGVDLWAQESKQDDDYDPVKAIDGVLMARAVVEDSLEGVFDDRLGDPRWMLMNAARPLTGSETQEGPFLAGRYYALIDLEEDSVAVALQMNHDLDARVVMPVTEAEMRQMALNTFGAKYKDRLHEFEPDIIEAQITQWVDQMHDRSYQDYQSLLLQARADLSEAEEKSLQLPADPFEGDMRGMAYAITDSQGRVAATGTVPPLIGADEEFAHINYYQQLTKTYAGQLWVAPMSNLKVSEVSETPLIFGMTWEQLSARQQGADAPAVRPDDAKIPEGAAMVFDSNAAAQPEVQEEQSDETVDAAIADIDLWPVPAAPRLQDYAMLVEGAREVGNKGYRGSQDIKLSKQPNGTQLVTYKGTPLGVFEGRASKRTIQSAIADRNYELQTAIYTHLFARLQNDVARPIGLQINVRGISDPAQLAAKSAQPWDLLPDISLNNALVLSERVALNFDIRIRLDDISIRVGVREQTEENIWRSRDASWLPASQSYSGALRTIPEQIESLADRPDTDPEVARLLRQAASAIQVDQIADDEDAVTVKPETDQTNTETLPLVRRFALSDREGELSVAVAAASLLRDASLKKTQIDALQSAIYSAESEAVLREIAGDEGLSHSEVKSKLAEMAGLDLASADQSTPSEQGADKAEAESTSRADSRNAVDVRQDYGEFVPGARKHEYGHDWGMWNDRQAPNVERYMMGGRQLTDSDRATARKMARKIKMDQFWPEPTFDLSGQGQATPAASLYRLMVRAGLPYDTNAVVAGNSRDGRHMSARQWLVMGAAFAERVEALKERSERIITNEDVVNEFIDYTGAGGPYGDVRKNLLDYIHVYTNYYELLTSTEALQTRMAEHREAVRLAPSLSAVAEKSRYVKVPTVTDFVEAIHGRMQAVVTAYPELSQSHRAIAKDLEMKLYSRLLQHKDDRSRAYAEYSTTREITFDDYKERKAELDQSLIADALADLDQALGNAPMLGRLLLSPDMYVEDVVRVLESSDPEVVANSNLSVDTADSPENAEALANPDRLPGTPDFDTWFANSQIRDDDGNPLRVFHGTDAVFTQFDEQHKGKNTGWSNTNLGFFFIADRAQAEQFAKDAGGEVVVEAYLSIKKPLMLTTQAIFNNEEQAPTVYEIISGQRLSPADALAALNDEIGLGELPDVMEAMVTDDAKAIMLRDGYDGVISEFGGDHLEYVVFNASQIQMVPAEPEVGISKEESAILQVPSRKKPAPRFKNLRRTGELVREGDVTEEMVAKTFGLRAIQYGEWVTGPERQAMLNMSYDSFADLANALAVPSEFIGFNGQLALALGARGRGGTAAAHFEPGENIINLTKTMGAGTLFHEYSHALDHFLKGYVSHRTNPQHMFQIGTGVYLSNGLDRSVMDNRKRPEALGKADTPVIHPVMYNLISDLVGGKGGQANHELMKQRVAADAIERTLIGPLMSKKVLESLVDRFARSQAREQAEKEFPEDSDARNARAEALKPEFQREGYRIANNWRKTLKPYTDDLARRAALSGHRDVSDDFMRALFKAPSGNKRWMWNGGQYALEQMNTLLSEKEISLSEDEQAFAELWFNEMDYTRHARKVYKAVLNDVGGYDGKHSNFMRDAMSLDGSAKMLYWSNTQELWARGFSAILHDRLEKQGVTNDFASRFSAPKVFDGDGFVASSNPEGEEREWFYQRAIPFFSALQKVAHEVCPGSEMSEHVVSDDEVRAFVTDTLNQFEVSIHQFIDCKMSYLDAQMLHSQGAIQNFIELYGEVLPELKQVVADWVVGLQYPEMGEGDASDDAEREKLMQQHEQRRDTFNHWIQREVYPALTASGVIGLDEMAQMLRANGNEQQLLEYWRENGCKELEPDVLKIFECRLDDMRQRLGTPIPDGDRAAEMALSNAAHKAQSLGCTLLDQRRGTDMGEEQIQRVIDGVLEATINGGASPWLVFKTFDEVTAWRIKPEQIERLAESILTEDYDECQFDVARSFVTWLAEKRGWEGHGVTPDIACRYLVSHPHGQHPSQAMKLAFLPGTDTDALIMHAVDSLDTALDVDTVEHLYDRLEQHNLQIKESTLDFVLSKHPEPMVRERLKKQGECYLIDESGDALSVKRSSGPEMRV